MFFNLKIKLGLLLTERESFWIEKLNCYVPNGLNLKEEV